MSKKAIFTLAGGVSALLISNAISAQHSSLPSAKVNYHAVINLTNSEPADEFQLTLREVTLPPARISSPFDGFDFNTALIITGDPELNISLAKWTLVSGTLPAGLTLSSSGQLTGTPTESANAAITLQVMYKGKATTGKYIVQANDGTLKLVEEDGVRQWSDGRYAKNCGQYRFPNHYPESQEYKYEGATGDGVYRITPGGTPVDAWCDMTTEGGGWTSYYKQETFDTNFNQPWATYEQGFGDPAVDYFIGLSTIHSLSAEPVEYLANYYDLETKSVLISVSSILAEGAVVSIGPSSEKYLLEQRSINGEEVFYRAKFTTVDQDNTVYGVGRCFTDKFKQGWWVLDIGPIASCEKYNSDYHMGGTLTVPLGIGMAMSFRDAFLQKEELRFIDNIKSIRTLKGSTFEYDLRNIVTYGGTLIDFSQTDWSINIVAGKGSDIQINNGILTGEVESTLYFDVTLNYLGKSATSERNIIVDAVEGRPMPQGTEGVYYSFDIKQDLFLGVEGGEDIVFLTNTPDFENGQNSSGLTLERNGTISGIPKKGFYLLTIKYMTPAGSTLSARYGLTIK